jgi:type II secretory pathway pseudopilin PulG
MSRPPRRKSSRAQAFSLVELLLVLALMAAVAALAWPTVRRQFDNYRLKTAADMVRTEWCLARIEAMRSGCVCTFRNSREGNRFFTQHATDSVASSSPARSSASSSASPSAPSSASSPAPASPPPLGASPPAQPAGAVADGAPPPAAAAGTELQPGEKLLPEGVDFKLLETASDPAAADAEIAAGAQEPAPSDWSDPIFFYPDGTTSDAQLTLKNGQGRAIELNLRGLTGTVDVGDILTVEE